MYETEHRGRGETSKNLYFSDLVLVIGRRPELKADDFSEVPPVVVEIISILVEIARRLCYHLLGFEVRRVQHSGTTLNKAGH